MNMGVQIYLWDPDFNPFGYIPRSGLTGSCGSSLWRLQQSKMLLCRKQSINVKAVCGMGENIC